MSESIQQKLPILEIADNYIVSKRGDISIVLLIVKPELFSLSAWEIANQFQAWVKAISLLPYGTIVHLMDWYIRTTCRPTSAFKDQSSLSKFSNCHFFERPFFEHCCYCTITFRIGSRQPVTSAGSSLLKRSLVPDALLNPVKVQDMIHQCRRFLHVLTENSTITGRMLRGEELAGTADQQGLLEQYLQLMPSGSKPQLADIDLDKGIRIGNKRTRLYTLADADLLPPQCGPVTRYEPYSTERTTFPIGFATALGPLLPVNHIYNQYLFIDDPAPTLKLLETRRRRLKSLGGQNGGNALALEHTTQYLEVAAKGEQRPLKAGFSLFCYTDKVKDLPALEDVAVTAITSLGAVPHLETVGAPQIWWAGMPGNAADFPINELFPTFLEPAACFFIPESNGRRSAGGRTIRLGDRATGIPLDIDLTDEPMRRGLIANLNKFILGGSGSGKSYFANHLLRSRYELGDHILGIDIGGSYQTLCTLLRGTYFSYNPDNPLRFNPFRLEDGEIADTEKRESLKNLLLVLWKKSNEAFGRSEYIALSNILEGYYQYLASNPSTYPCFDSFYEWVRDLFVPHLDHKGVREKDFDWTNFLYVLRPYYRGGEFEYLLNSRDETSLLHNRFILFELDQIKDHPILFPIVTIVIMDVFIGKMRQLKGDRKIIMLDEAWKALAKEGMAEYVKYLFKTVRKFNGEAIVITQDIEDLVDSKVVKNTIINNADCRILMDQSKFMNRFDQIENLLGLTEKDKMLVLSLNKANDPDLRYKEVFISLGAGHSRVYRTEVSLEESLVYTTEPSQKLKVQEYSERYGDLLSGVVRLAEAIRSGAVKFLLAGLITAAFLLLPNHRASAQIIDIAEEIIKEALETADLKIQRLQTETLYLQETAKEVENAMAGDLLDDITGWVQQQDELFAEYYAELWQVKSAFSTYGKVAQLIDRQVQLVREYQQATSAIWRDPHFSLPEVQQMLNVYSGILNASIRNTRQLALVIQAFTTQMDDAGRLRIIDQTAANVSRNYSDLHSYTQQNTLLSLQRAKDEADIQTIKTLYGIE